MFVKFSVFSILSIVMFNTPSSIDFEKPCFMAFSANALLLMEVSNVYMNFQKQLLWALIRSSNLMFSKIIYHSTISSFSTIVINLDLPRCIDFLNRVDKFVMVI